MDLSLSSIKLSLLEGADKIYTKTPSWLTPFIPIFGIGLAIFGFLNILTGAALLASGTLISAGLGFYFIFSWARDLLIETLKTENAQLKNEIKELKKENAELKIFSFVLLNKNRELKTVNSNLQQENKALKEKNIALILSVNIKERTNIKLKQEKNKLIEQVNNLQEQISSLKEENKALKQQLEEKARQTEEHNAFFTERYGKPLTIANIIEIFSQSEIQSTQQRVNDFCEAQTAQEALKKERESFEEEKSNFLQSLQKIQETEQVAAVSELVQRMIATQQEAHQKTAAHASTSSSS